METLQTLCDIVNGKCRRFFPISTEAAALFKQWLADYHVAPTLEAALAQWAPMDAVLNEHLQVRARCVGNQLQREVVVRRPRGNSVNDELLYLVLSFVNTPDCRQLRLCPNCGKCFIGRGGQKFCIGLCGRRFAAARIVEAAYDDKRKRRIAACKAAHAKYQALSRHRRELEDEFEYVLREANGHLHKKDKIGGPKMQTNFITRNAKAIGIPPKGEK